jgi:hypothetical protein
MYQLERELAPAFKFPDPFSAAEMAAEKRSERSAFLLRYRSMSSDKSLTLEYRCAGSRRIARATIRSS